MKPTNYESIPDKAQRLKANFRVILVRAGLALVIGDHGTYKVEKGCSRWSCDCKRGRYRGAWRECSHILAVKSARKDPASQEPVARLADWLMEAQVG